MPNRVSGITGLGQDFYTAFECGAAGGSSDFVATFVAPQSGTYVIDTFGSDFDTVLAVLDGVCGNSELACNDDVEGSEYDLLSEVSVQLHAGQGITIVVDGFDGDTGPFQLNLNLSEPADCPDLQLASSPTVSQVGSTEGQPAFVRTSCVDQDAPAATFVYTAPATGTYLFDTRGSDFDTVLGLFDGYCGERELDCNDDSIGLLSELEIELDAGQTVTVAVTGHYGSSGSFQLNIQQLGGGCPDGVLPVLPMVSQVGSTVGQASFHQTSCDDEEAPATTYVYTAPTAGTYLFDTQGSSFDTVLALFAGFCGELELTCNDDTYDGLSEVQSELDAGQTVTVVVTGFDGSSGSFQLNIQQLRGGCPDGELPALTEVSQVGSTVGQASFHETSCGAAGDAPDTTYRYTAPVASTYVFDTIGSDFDTVLALLDGNCDGPELGCNDDTHGVQSELQAYLQAGQTVTIVVTGYSGATGEFRLNVNIE